MIHSSLSALEENLFPCFAAYRGSLPFLSSKPLPPAEPGMLYLCHHSSIVTKSLTPNPAEKGPQYQGTTRLGWTHLDALTHACMHVACLRMHARTHACMPQSPISKILHTDHICKVSLVWKTAYSQFRELECGYPCMCVCAQFCLFVTPWTVAFQAPLSMGFSRQTYWRGFPFPSPVDHPVPGMFQHLLHVLLWQVDMFMWPLFCLSQGGTLSNKHQHISSNITWIVQAS